MHKPVLLEKVVEHLGLPKGGVLLDGTLGGGGHARAILAGVADSRVIGIDRDESALLRARENLGPLAVRVEFIHGAFADMIQLTHQLGLQAVDSVLLDLGFSSDQIDNPERGFSFMADGLLDMRMNRNQTKTAAVLVNELPERELADLLWSLGEESASRRVASAIVSERRTAPIRTTLHLADVVSRAKGGRHGRIHPATQTFQALRMAVNDELEQAGQGFESAMKLVREGGRVAVITFHSGEDRVIKQAMSRHVGRDVALPQGGSRWEGDKPCAKWIVKKPLTATEDEVRANPRARSAKLRVVERGG